MTERTVTLYEILESRENRVRRQEELLLEFGGVLISVTLNIPGSVKDRPSYRKALRMGIEMLKKKLPEGRILHIEVRELPTGAEAYFIVDGMTASEVKRITVEIEDSSSIGRLFDMDVLAEKGSVSRVDLGMQSRRCLLCSEDAKICARTQRHSIDELLTEIDRILEMSLPRKIEEIN
ncbi:citrate lyase holo-[acyl-carrier protein] synthase [Ihubacter sp. mB4P-1]|uniref:citrate lyase holo-[acyl-carrier protein] synthase n=1 Tax=Ihubacter sp. mB4P-1 TaxID=3242370 RepID=UPI00137A7C02